MNKSEFMEILDDFLVKNQISASALARAVGVSSPMISQLRKGLYKGDFDGVSQKISSYIKNYIQKKPKNTLAPKEVVCSNDYMMASFVIDEAVEEREIALIYGEAGTGKTTLFIKYASDHPNVILVQATVHTSARELLDELCEKLGVSARTLEGKIKAISNHLKTADKIIIVDEAEHLPLRALEDLRRIYDFSQTPLIIGGTEVLLKNLLGKSKELKQLYSRICGKWVMRGLSEEECGAIYGRFIFKYTRGNFRSSAKLFKKASRLSALKGVDIDDEIVSNATSMVVLA